MADQPAVDDARSDLDARLASVMKASPAVVEKLKSRGKMLARDRLAHLADEENGSILELSTLAADGLYEGRFPSAGLVTAIAKVCGVWCAVMINEGSTMGGTWVGLSCEKALRLQEIAMKLGLPALISYIVDSGGAFLHTQAETFPEKFGRIFANEAKMSAQGRPQLAAVVGMSTAGGAYIPAMCDEIVMCETNGTIYLAGPPLVRAATGEVVTEQDLGGAVVHNNISGKRFNPCRGPGCKGPVPLEVEKSAIAMLRQLTEAHCERFKSSFVTPLPTIERGKNHPRDAIELLDELLDGGVTKGFKEFMPDAGQSILAGFGQLTAHGGEVAFMVGRSGQLSREDAQKGIRFIKMLNKKAARFHHLCLVVVHTKRVLNEDDRASAEFYRKLHLIKVPKIAVVTGDSFINAKLPSLRTARLALPASPTASCLDFAFRFQWPEATDAYKDTALLLDDGVIDARDTKLVVTQCASICRQRSVSACL
ncbi:hypothetical protein FOL47_008742 [Perkinsus chesapeaki]|uniref:methylcrotonoyl-CoA carboxylase n=1 Tax=Perkinsus chesapeaki TaxID=330153 RepID=A0A7J6LC71_PERCH|nr:hypothetical protein FOL47_008742 [Perkinsus chesapeaki]